MYNYTIGIVDYGMGNLHSVVNALDYLGAKSLVSSDKSELDGCAAIILPGVGAFADAMKRLSELDMTAFLRSQALEFRKPFLGICLGMQMLFDKSYEFGEHEGLGLIGGTVELINPISNGQRLKIPHMGWSSLHKCKASRLLANISDGEYVYFVHSYAAKVKNRDDLAAVCDHGGEITAAVERENIMGTQFHPEKSCETGMKILRAFLSVADEAGKANS